MRDRDTLRGACGTRGEDDPGVVVGGGRADLRHLRAARGGAGPHAVGGEDRRHPGLPEHQLGALVGVVRVDRHVRRAGRQDRQDRHVQIARTRRHPHADPVARAHSCVREAAGAGIDLCEQLAIGEGGRAVVDRGRVRVLRGRRLEDVDEGAGCGREARPQELGGYPVRQLLVRLVCCLLGQTIRDVPLCAWSGGHQVLSRPGVRRMNTRPAGRIASSRRFSPGCVEIGAPRTSC